MNKKHQSHKGLWITLITIFSVITILFASFFMYTSVYEHPTEEAKATMKKDDIRIEETDDYLLFESKSRTSSTGFIFYPGAKVDPVSYAPFLHDLALNGVSSILVKMPFRLAFFDIDGADGKKQLCPHVRNWYIGGHSLGGAMAAEYLSSDTENHKGLILLASYSTKDISATNLRTLSIKASNDKVLNEDKYQKYKKNLPNLKEVTIEGGCHSYFGDYGIQKHDGEPTITVEEQRKKVVSAMVSFFIVNAL